jgi:hypothetical protein
MKARIILIMTVPLLYGYPLPGQGNSGSGKDKIQHMGNPHMWLVRQAYSLLVTQLGDSIPFMGDHLGNEEHGTLQFIPGGKIVIGAFREDEEDVNHGGSTGPHTTCTHFWDPDSGDASHFLDPIRIAHDNAFFNAQTYIGGNYQLIVPREDYIFLADVYQAPSLVDFYNTGHIYRISSARYDMMYGVWVLYDYDNQWSYLPRYEIDRITWEILGRVAHLLADVGTPAHAHYDAHISGDSYEQYMDSYPRYSPYDATAALNQHLCSSDPGGFIDATDRIDPLKYLFYTTAQIADFYPSYGAYGDNDPGSNDPFNVYPPLDSIISNLGPVPWPVCDPDTIASVAFVYSLRATAGLFYWFGMEAGLIMRPFV